MLKLMVRYVMPSIFLSLFLVLGFTGAKASAAVDYSNPVDQKVHEWVQTVKSDYDILNYYHYYAYVIVVKQPTYVEVFYSNSPINMTQNDVLYGLTSSSPFRRDTYSNNSAVEDG